MKELILNRDQFTTYGFADFIHAVFDFGRLVDQFALHGS